MVCLRAVYKFVIRAFVGTIVLPKQKSMTFIASVIARKGVAVIADSLATSMEKVVSYDRFINYLKRKQESANGSEIRIGHDEIGQLFEKKPSHTNDYAEKLFQFDQFTAITLAGASQIGGKMIESLIQELATINEQHENYQSKAVIARVTDFCEFMDSKARICIAAKGRLGKSILMFTHYETITEKTIMYRIIIDKPVMKSAEKGQWEYVSCEKISEDRYVVSEGQNHVSKRILKEESKFSFGFIPYIIEKMSKNFNLLPGSISFDYVQQLLDEVYLNRQSDNLTIQASLSNLSLQEAVNMAYLLLKMEITFQSSTEKIPTVGGRIKIAVIDKHGFRYITGHNILEPY